LKRKQILACILALVLVLSLAACGGSSSSQQSAAPAAPAANSAPAAAPADAGGIPADGEVYTLIFADDVAEDSVRGIIMKHFEEVVEEKSNGKIQIERYHATLGNVSELGQAVRDGSVDIMSLCLGSQFDDRFASLDIPRVFADMDKSTEVMREGEFRDAIDKLCEEVGVKLVFQVPVNYRLLTTNREIKSFDDLKGMNIRTPTNPVFTAFWEACGTNPTPLPLDEVYMALSQGLVEAQENPYDLILQNKFNEVQKYLVHTNHITFNTSFIINLNSWNNLPEAYQKVFLDSMKETEDYAIGARDQINADYGATLEAAGTTTQLYPDEALQEALDNAAKSTLPIIRQLAGDEIVDVTLKAMGFESWIE